MGCSGYDALARVYEILNNDIDYSAWADFFERCFDKYLKERPSLVLDLACGTGTMTRELAKRGYDMIGVDGSPEMLSEAFSKNDGEHSILYLNQDMREFELYGTVGAVSCCLDSINYLLSENDVKKTFSLVHNYLDPDGLFMFDVNSPYKFENIYGDNAYILEDEGVYCGWQNFYDEKSGICDFYLSIFEEEDGKYYRCDEHQEEKCYTRETLEELLTKCGFEVLDVVSDFDFSTPTEKTERYYFVARAKK